MLPRTIKKRAMFLNVMRHGTIARTKGVVSICQRIDASCSFVGYTASRRVGNAVKRNFAKRRMRALIREFSNEFSPGYAFVFIANTRTTEMKFAELKSDFCYSLKKSKKEELRSA